MDLFSDSPYQTKKRSWPWVVGGVVVMWVALLVFGGKPDPERAASERAVSMCHDELSKQPAGSGTAEIVAGACAQLEREHQQKYR